MVINGSSLSIILSKSLEDEKVWFWVIDRIESREDCLFL